jgi:hypothetical protein
MAVRLPAGNRANASITLDDDSPQSECVMRRHSDSRDAYANFSAIARTDGGFAIVNDYIANDVERHGRRGKTWSSANDGGKAK